MIQPAGTKESWRNCPLMKEYQHAKKAYINEKRQYKHALNQQARLWSIVCEVIAFSDEPKKLYWCERLFRYYSKRLAYHRGEWIPFIADFTDEMAYGTYTNPKTKRYCLMIRDAAAERMRIEKDAALRKPKKDFA